MANRLSFNLILFLTLHSFIARAACGDAEAPNLNNVEKLVLAIEKKFDLTTENVRYRCGGSAVEFKFKPSILLVPEDSYFVNWNSSFSLGTVDSGEDMISKLQALLDTPVDRVEKLKIAQSQIVWDSKQVEIEYGIDVQFWPVGAKDSKSVLEVSAPFCKNDYSNSSQAISQILVPISTIGALIQLPNSELYSKGDLMKALVASPEFKKSLDMLSSSNIAAEEYVQQRFHDRSYCSTYYDGKNYSVRDWNKTRVQFGLQPLPANGL